MIIRQKSKAIKLLHHQVGNKKVKRFQSSAGRTADPKKNETFLEVVKICEKLCDEHDFCTLLQLQNEMEKFCT